MTPDLYATGLLTDEQLLAVAHAAIESSNLDSLAEEMICSICGFKEHARKAMVEGKQLGAKLSLLRTLVNERLTDEYERGRFNSMMDEHIGAVSDRNALVHGRWVHAVADARDVFVLHKEKKPVPAIEAIAVAHKLASFQSELSAFYMIHGDELKTWQQTRA